MRTNTATRYGSVARFFHWSIAVLILIDIALGVLGKNIPRSAENIEFLKILYSTHKTIGVTVLGLAVLRVVWAITQPRPVPLHPERRLETFAAETAHWMLYAAIFILPLSGWVMHSAEVGFAPIWWPFGQDLPFIPKSEDIAHRAATVHWIAGVVLAATIAAHIGGALKHAVVDRDETLARMVRGGEAGNTVNGVPKHVASAIMASVIWVGAIGGAVVLYAPTPSDVAAGTAATADTGGWAVQDGAVQITVVQLGAPVTGRFGNWDATIEYDPASGTGQVTAVIDTTSLTLGSVTDQAKGPEFFDVATYAQATFEAEITKTEGVAHTAVGTLILVGQTVPVTLGFDLEVADGTAVMSGATMLDRRDFEMGTDYPDESSVGFSVDVDIDLIATQSD